MTIEKDVPNAADRVLVGGDVIRLVNIPFVYCFKETSLSTTGSSDIEYKKYCGQVSTVMRVLTSMDGEYSSHLDEIDESQTEIENTSLKHLLIKGQLPLEYFFGFCRTFKKINKHLGFQLTFKTADLQDTFYKTLGDVIKVKFDRFFF